MQRSRREDRVDGLVEVEVQRVLAPQLGAVAEPATRERDHVRRRVHGQYAATWNELQQRLRNSSGAAADVEHGCVLRDARQPCEHL
ncbi:MAG TPA: hypothetical protein VKG82_04425 [Solirubrobacteraceae bacterium]|nr:hypothetical protein [Solirubrobacteraceae bacterium]